MSTYQQGELNLRCVFSMCLENSKGLSIVFGSVFLLYVGNVLLKMLSKYNIEFIWLYGDTAGVHTMLSSCLRMSANIWRLGETLERFLERHPWSGSLTCILFYFYKSSQIGICTMFEVFHFHHQSFISKLHIVSYS